MLEVVLRLPHVAERVISLSDRDRVGTFEQCSQRLEPISTALHSTTVREQRELRELPAIY